MTLHVAEPSRKGVNSNNESKDAAQSPLRKALSPININAIQEPLEALSFTQTPFLTTCSNKGIQKDATPLGKFSTRSSTLKVGRGYLTPLTNELFEPHFSHLFSICRTV